MIYNVFNWIKNTKKILVFVFIAFLLLIGIQFVLAQTQTKPSGSPPSPWWSPSPSSAQSYISAICGSGDPIYQAWCSWLTAHPEDVPASYYPAPTVTYAISGHVKNQNASAVSGVLVTATASCPISPVASASATTDASGYYSMSLSTDPGLGWSGICGNNINIAATKTNCSFNATQLATLQNATKDFNGTCNASPPLPSPPPPSNTNTIVNLSEFDDTLIKATNAYLTRTDKGGLTELEMKDLTAARSNASGSTINLSGKGAFSGENLIDIYNKFKAAAGVQTSGAQPPATPPANVSAITMTPSAYRTRYTYYCGIANSGLVQPGETKYYKIDMTKWLDWQKLRVAGWKNNAQIQYNECVKYGQDEIANWNQYSQDRINFYNSCCVVPHDENNLVTQACFNYSFGGGCDAPPSAPDPNYTRNVCDPRLAGDNKTWDDYMKQKDDLYKSGNWTSVFSRESAVGCDPYVNGGGGCEEQNNIIEIAFGYNQALASDNFSTALQSQAAYFASLPSALSRIKEWLKFDASNPFIVKQGEIYGRDYFNGGGTSVYFWKELTLDAGRGANAIYLTVHNKEGAARTFDYEMSCPDAVAK